MSGSKKALHGIPVRVAVFVNRTRRMGRWLSKRTIPFLICMPVLLYAQNSSTAGEIPIDRCDGLPVIRIQVDGMGKRFLLDTASTTNLNLKSFSSGRSRPISVTTWTGNTVANGRDILLKEVAAGEHRLRDLKLPAVDLSVIEAACGGPIDGILGFDLLEQLGMKIDLKGQVVSVEMSPGELQAEAAEMEQAMQRCNNAFRLGNVDALRDCLDPAIVLYTTAGEFRGRDQVMDYLQKHFLKFAPNLDFETAVRDTRILGDAVWSDYNYTIESPDQHSSGHGNALCLRTKGHWRILNMHNSQLPPEVKPEP